MYRFLYVCMGNICRSPTAKGVFDVALSERGIPFNSESAGTHGYHIGRPPDPRAIRAAASVGIEIHEDRARQVVAEDFHAFDRIFVMDRSNLEALQALRPDTARAAVQLVMDLVPGYGLDEVPDPYYGGEDGFVRVIDMLQAAALALADELAKSEEDGQSPQ